MRLGPELTFSRTYGKVTFLKTTFRALVSEALADKLRAQGERDVKPWMKTFGKLRHLRKETARINLIIEDEFDRIEIEDRR
jgi:hypothetical protein